MVREPAWRRRWPKMWEFRFTPRGSKSPALVEPTNGYKREAAACRSVFPFIAIFVYQLFFSAEHYSSVSASPPASASTPCVISANLLFPLAHACDRARPHQGLCQNKTAHLIRQGPGEQMRRRRRRRQDLTADSVMRINVSWKNGTLHWLRFISPSDFLSAHRKQPLTAAYQQRQVSRRRKMETLPHSLLQMAPTYAASTSWRRQKQSSTVYGLNERKKKKTRKIKKS